MASCRIEENVPQTYIWQKKKKPVIQGIHLKKIPYCSIRKRPKKSTLKVGKIFEHTLCKKNIYKYQKTNEKAFNIRS